MIQMKIKLKCKKKRKKRLRSGQSEKKKATVLEKKTSGKETQTSDVGKKKSAFWQRGQSFTRSSSCQPTDKRLSAQCHLALTRLLWITLFHSLFHSVIPFPPCSAYYHRAARREWFKTYTFRFKKLMLGLGRSLSSHLRPSGGSARRLKKQVSSPLHSLMLLFADNKLKRKPDSEINVSKRSSPRQKHAWLTRWLIRPMVSADSLLFPLWRRSITPAWSSHNLAWKVAEQMMMMTQHIKLLLHQSTQSSNPCTAAFHNMVTVPLCCLGHHFWLECSEVGYQVETFHDRC